MIVQYFTGSSTQAESCSIVEALRLSSLVFFVATGANIFLDFPGINFPGDFQELFQVML